MGASWTHREPLPDGEMQYSDFELFMSGFEQAFPKMPPVYLHRLARRHGAGSADVLGDAQTIDDLGRHFGGDLYEREVDHLMRHEWAQEPEDVLWRRTKLGLTMPPAGREALAAFMVSAG